MFLGLRKPYFLGVDFGTASIKVVELTLENGKPKLTNYGQADLMKLEKDRTPGVGLGGDDSVVYLRALLEQLHPKSQSAYVAMPAFIGLVSLIELPEMDESDLGDAIKFEAHKYIPSPLEEVALSYEVVGIRQGEDGSQKMEVLLVAALNKEVDRYKQCITDAHLKLEFLELETFSLARSLVQKQEGLYLIADIGSRATNLILVDNGLVKVSRNLDAGGKDITRTLHESLNIAVERAETLKKSDKDFLNVPESAMVFPTLEMVASEAQRMLDTYLAKYPEKECQEMILSGGTAHMAGLVEYYKRVLGLSVRVGDPWQGIQHDANRAEDIKQLGTSFSVAIGLALAGTEAITKKEKPITSKKSFSLKELLNKKL